MMFRHKIATISMALIVLTFGCHAANSKKLSPLTAQAAAKLPLLPDATMTPGAILPVTKDDICVPGYSKKVRNVPASVKRQVYEEYGIKTHKKGEFEVDHLISLELGGSNSIKNLWPESYLTEPWNARVKDALENELHRQVCSGQIDLQTAQHDIATDWIGAYKKYFHVSAPRSSDKHSHNDDDVPTDASTSPTVSQPTAAPATATGDAPRVWVNTKSGKYFLPGARYYGKTKSGQYMTEADAAKQGYTPAKGQ